MPLSRRRSTRVLIIWTIVAAIVAYLIYRHNQNNCNHLLGQQVCQEAGLVSFWRPFVTVWLVGLVIIGIVWLITRPKKRLCPVCGEDVAKGLRACPACGHDFAAAASAGEIAGSSAPLTRAQAPAPAPPPPPAGVNVVDAASAAALEDPAP